MPKDIITKGDIVDVLIFNKVPFDNKPFALIPKKMKLGIGLTKDVQNVLNVKLNSDIAKLLRGHKQGDKIKLAGGTKKIKDLFIDLKIPREERCKVPIIADEQGILQIGEYKSSENYKIDEKTKEVLKVTFKKL